MAKLNAFNGKVVRLFDGYEKCYLNSSGTDLATEILPITQKHFR